MHNATIDESRSGDAGLGPRGQLHQHGGSSSTVRGSASSAGPGRGASTVATAWQGHAAPQGLSMHGTPFSAMAAILDDCILRAAMQSGPTCANWDVRSDPLGGGPLLVFEHDCNGMCLEELYAMLGLEATPAGGSRPAPANGRASALMHAVMRLGSSATVLTKRLSAGKVLPSVGLGVIVFDPGPPPGARAGALYCMPDQSLQDGASGAPTPGDFNAAFERGGYASWEDIYHELDTMQPQGTKILVRGLWGRPDGGAELDVGSDPSDIRCHKGDALADLLPLERKDVGVQRCMLHRYSFRAYASILYRRWPDGFLLIIRGLPVQIQDIRAWLRGCVSEEYRPRGVKDEVDEHGFQMQHVVHVHVGFLIDVPRTSMQGFCLYHKNRLVKPFWRVYSSSTVGRGVVGYLEADFVSPTPDWQDFERSHAFLKLEAFLKRCVPAYWKKHAAAGGYLGGQPASAAAPVNPSRQAPVGPASQMLTLAPSGRHLTTPFSGQQPHQLALAAQQAGGMPPTQQQQQQQQQAAVAAAVGAVMRQRSGSLGLPPIHTQTAGGQPPLPDHDLLWGSGLQLSGWPSSSLGSLTPPSAGGGPSLFQQLPSSAADQGGFLLPQPGGLMMGSSGAGHSIAPQQMAAALAQGAPGAPSYGRGRLTGGPAMQGQPPAGIPYGAQAMLPPFSSGQNSQGNIQGNLPGQAGPGLMGPGAAGDTGPPPIHQLQRLLASAPEGVMQQLQQGMDSAGAFFPAVQQAQQGGAAQQATGPEWELPGGAWASSSLDLLQLQGRQASGVDPSLSTSLGLEDAIAQQSQQQQQQQQQQAPAAEQAPAANLAHALAMLATQPHQLSQVLCMLGQEVQQAEQAGLPSSSNLRQMQSLLSRLAAQDSESPQSQAGTAPERPFSRTASMPQLRLFKPPSAAAAGAPGPPAQSHLLQQEGGSGGGGSGGSGSPPPPTGGGVGTRLVPVQSVCRGQAVQRLPDPPSIEPPLARAGGTAEGAAGETKHLQLLEASGATAGLASLPAGEATAKAEQVLSLPTGGSAKPADLRAQTSVPSLALRLGGDIAAFVRRAVPEGPLRDEGLLLARRVKAAVEQLLELHHGSKRDRCSPANSSKGPLDSEAKRQRT